MKLIISSLAGGYAAITENYLYYISERFKEEIKSLNYVSPLYVGIFINTIFI